MILPAVYNGPLIFYALLVQTEQEKIIEQHEHYTKQTYRNRCRISGANGVITLTVPVRNDHGRKTLVRDVRIEDDNSWKKDHWRSIYSAYASSPFFEFTVDHYRPVYKQKHFTFLLDLNMELIRITLDILDIQPDYRLSDAFEPIQPDDPRENIHPKRAFHSEKYRTRYLPYHQVFEERFGFKENLSILDLVFNEGPNASSILANMLITENRGE